MRLPRLSPQRSTAIALFLAIALLLAQWSGLAHRIEHAHLQHDLAQASSVADDEDPDARHSCVAFDAAAIADTIHLLPFVALLLTSPRVLALWVAFTSWNAPLVLPFSPRAPPLA